MRTLCRWLTHWHEGKRRMTVRATEEPSRELRPSPSWFDASWRKRRGCGRREEGQREEEYPCFKMVVVKNNVVSTGTERQADQVQRRV